MNEPLRLREKARQLRIGLWVLVPFSVAGLIGIAAKLSLDDSLRRNAVTTEATVIRLDPPQPLSRDRSPIPVASFIGPDGVAVETEVEFDHRAGLAVGDTISITYDRTNARNTSANGTDANLGAYLLVGIPFLLFGGPAIWTLVKMRALRRRASLIEASPEHLAYQQGRADARERARREGAGVRRRS